MYVHAQTLIITSHRLACPIQLAVLISSSCISDQRTPQTVPLVVLSHSIHCPVTPLTFYNFVLRNQNKLFASLIDYTNP